MHRILILCLLPLPALASEPERTHIFCDQYARSATGQSGVIRGGRTGAWVGGAAGAAKNGSKGAGRGGLLGGTIGAAQGGQWDRQVIDFYYEECISGHRLTAPWPPRSTAN